MQTHIPKICSDFLQNHIDKRMFEIYNKFTVKEQTFANICFESMGGICKFVGELNEFKSRNAIFLV